MAILAQPTQVRGDIQFRDQASNGMELWNLSGNQTLALDEANGDKVRMQQLILDLSQAVRAIEQVPCKFWQMACKRKQGAGNNSASIISQH